MESHLQKRVRWQWLILPALLVLANLVLLVLTVVDSRRGHIAIWKYSMLPLLLWGRTRYPDQETLVPEMLSDMELIAKALDVRLVRREDGMSSLQPE